MSRTKRMKISTKDINDMIKSLNNLSNNLDQLKNDIPKEIAEDGLKYLNKLYNKTPSDENIEDINTSIGKSLNGYSIISQGKDVIYAEFGTGDKGENSPHREKSKYGLKGYNTGKTIRGVNPNNKSLIEHGITSGKYWTYEKEGKIIYTQGIPSGMQMFNTSNYLRSKGIKNILDKKVRDVLSKV